MARQCGSDDGGVLREGWAFYEGLHREKFHSPNALQTLAGNVLQVSLAHSRACPTQLWKIFSLWGNGALARRMWRIRCPGSIDFVGRVLISIVRQMESAPQNLQACIIGIGARENVDSTRAGGDVGSFLRVDVPTAASAGVTSVST